MRPDRASRQHRGLTPRLYTMPEAACEIQTIQKHPASLSVEASIYRSTNMSFPLTWKSALFRPTLVGPPSYITTHVQASRIKDWLSHVSKSPRSQVLP
ncbi:uncharacterized protein LOC135216327 isoform X3 [Macrobrachium nipponense]|uniref:uncharacterized protein LOC135216327 isoform X3 n=1 Tax=Macrobrachium nipponense TaxID=159736 RepID=UPI0030C85D45